MIDPSYVISKEFPPYVDTTDCMSHINETLRGSVSFKFQNIVVGDTIVESIEGSIPRITPKTTREKLTHEQLSKLKHELRTWIQKYFDFENQTTYYDEFMEFICYFCAYTNPFPALDSQEFLLVLRHTMWTGLMDDILETCLSKNLPPDSISSGMKQLLAVAQKCKPVAEWQRIFEDVEGWPALRPLYLSFVDLQEDFGEHNSEVHKHSGGYTYLLGRYFDATHWASIERIEKQYSENTFLYWRRIMAFYDLLLASYCMLREISLPNDIFNSPLTRRILDILVTVMGATNDLLGVKKEFQYGQADNFVVYKVVHKGKGLEVAVAEVVQLIKDEIIDYVNLRDALVDEFNNNEHLLKFLDVLESMIDGNNHVYVKDRRHLSQDCITLN